MGITRRQAVEAIELHQILDYQPYLSEAEAREILRCDLGRGGLETRPVVWNANPTPYHYPSFQRLRSTSADGESVFESTESGGSFGVIRR